MKTNVLGLDGKKVKDIDLPESFKEPVRHDLINRASLAVRSNSFQPQGRMPIAGLQTSAEYVGRRRKYRAMICIGHARLPHIKLPKGRIGDVRRVPQSRGGRMPHLTKPEKTLVEKINKKERNKAVRCALTATTLKDLIVKRGHLVTGIEAVPLVIIDDFQGLKKTKEVKDTLIKLNVGGDLKKSEVKKTRAGRGKTRGRTKKVRKSVLLVVGEDKGILKAASNIPGVDACLAKNLNADLLAPGGNAGRLTLYTESAISQLKNLFT